MEYQANILVVDDEPDVLDNIRTILTEENFSVQTAKNGKAGLEIIKHGNIDLVLCDIMMPKLNGFEMLEELNKSESIQVPFIYLSAKTEGCDFRKGMSLGADDYLFKPFSIEELIETVQLRLYKNRLKLSSEDKQTETQNRYNLSDQVFINVKDTLHPIRISDIKYVVAKNQYSEIIISNQKSITVKKPLSHWENIFPLKDFRRVHRSFLVNTNYIQKIKKWFKNQYRIHIENDESPISVSRRYASKVLPNLKL